MKYFFKERYYNIPDKELLTDLHKTALRLGKKYISKTEYDRDGIYSADTITKRFKGWKQALFKAGLEYIKKNKKTSDELYYELKRVWDLLGRQPVYGEMCPPLSMYYARTYADHFGTWNRALAEFVKAVNEENPVSFKDAALIKETKRNIPDKEHPVKCIISKSMRFDVLQRDNFKCVLCGASPADNPKVKLHVDHIFPKSKGGKSIIDNLQTLCSECNLGKAAKQIVNNR